MKRLLFVSLGLFLFALPSRAQSSVDASVGYSYFHLGNPGNGSNPEGSALNQNGGSASVAYNPIPFMGVVADIGGYHGTFTVDTPNGPESVSVNTYTFLFGPRINFKNPTKVTPFAQFLVGAERLTASNQLSAITDFSYSVGGGVDLRVLPHFALRPQVDYVGVRHSGATNNCVRVSISAVVHF